MTSDTLTTFGWFALGIGVAGLLASAFPSAKIGRREQEGAISGIILGGLIVWWTGALDEMLFRMSRPELPQAQRLLLDRYHHFAAEWDKRTNDLAREPLRAERAEALCANGGPPTAEAWIARVESVRTNDLSDTITVTLRLSDRVTASTTGHFLAEPGRGTDLRRDDPLLPAVAALRQGETVRFSASFLRDQSDCIAEGSLTLRGGMREPILAMRLSGIAPVR